MLHATSPSVHEDQLAEGHDQTPDVATAVGCPPPLPPLPVPCHPSLAALGFPSRPPPPAPSATTYKRHPPPRPPPRRLATSASAVSTRITPPPSCASSASSCATSASTSSSSSARHVADDLSLQRQRSATVPSPQPQPRPLTYAAPRGGTTISDPRARTTCAFDHHRPGPHPVPRGGSGSGGTSAGPAGKEVRWRDVVEPTTTREQDQTSGSRGAGGSDAPSFGSAQSTAYRTYSSLDGEPPRFPLLLLDVYCVDVSSSMWFSPRAGPLGIFGKSKLDAAKEIMAPSESNLRKKHEQQSQRLEKEMPHYYIAKRKICLIKFHEKVKMLVPIGDEDRQRGVFQEQLRTLKHKKHTALMAALEFCEEEIQKWIDLKLTPEEQKMEKDVILHLFTDGHDTVADKQRRAQWQSYVGDHNKKDKKIYRTFLYTFSQDFTKSKDMAKWLSEIGSDTQLIVVDTAHPERAIDESWQQRDKMLFTLLRSKPAPTRLSVLTRKPSKRFRIGKYNYLANMDGEHNIGLDWTLEYLKKLEIVFQQEDFYQCTNIFRSEGDISVVSEVDKEFLEGKTSLESLERPLEVASATKRILRRSEPFIPLELQPKLIDLLLKPLPALEKGVAMANMMRDLPMENKQCLRILFSILHTVAANADQTQMPSGHLAIPFAPIIFKGKELVTLSDLGQLRFKDSIHATAYLIDNFPVFCNLLV